MATSFQPETALVIHNGHADVLLTPEQVAERLQMTKEWVYDHLTRSRPFIPAIRIGGKRAIWRIRPRDLEQFLAEHRFDPQSRKV